MKIRTYLKVAIKQLRQRLLIFFSKEGQGNISVVARDICMYNISRELRGLVSKIL